jgi:Na+-driven multidrug efflux pump
MGINPTSPKVWFEPLPGFRHGAGLESCSSYWPFRALCWRSILVGIPKFDQSLCSVFPAKSQNITYFCCTGKQAVNTPGLLDSAVEYVKIRAFSMPTSLFGGAVQAACLGGQDSVTPLVAIVWSTVINVIGDFILVKKYGMGLRGAAIATLIAQLVATLALVGPASRKLVRDRSFGLLKKPPTTPDSVSSKAFLGFAAPVLTLILGKLAAFGFLTNAAAGVPGQPTPLASHQIILSLFFFASPFLEVISQTAQSFIPTYLAPVGDHVAKMKKKNPKYDEDSDPVLKPWKQSAFQVGTTLLQLGFVSGTIIASLAAMVPAFRGSMLTSDPTLQTAVKPLAKYLWLSAFLTAPVAVSEGCLLARRELKFLASIYLVTTALLPPALVRVKLSGGNVEQVWACFAAFQLFRALLFSGRIWAGPIARRIAGIVGGSNPSKQAGTSS